MFYRFSRLELAIHPPLWTKQDGFEFLGGRLR